MPDVTFFSDWPRDAIMKTMDPFLVDAAIRDKETNLSYWHLLEPALKKHPKIFNKETITLKNFMGVFAQMVTRDFGWYLPSTCLIPMADNLNHSNQRT